MNSYELKLHPINLEERKNVLFASEKCQEIFDIYESFYPTIGFNPPWIGYFILKGNQVAGTCGFTGKPVENRIEIAYYTFKEFEGQGIASVACRLLVEMAQSENPALIITAKTLPEYNASTTILQRNGFQRSGIVHDHEIDDAWLWVRKES
jgi:RimJ/RimL family protein N-acetyltransferase